MKLSTRIITAVLLVGGSSGVVYAFSGHGDWGMSPDEKIEFVSERITRKLDLDDMQRQKFVEMAELVATTMRQVKPTREQRLGEISALLQEPSFNQARALELIRQKTQVVNDQAPLLIAALANFLDSLSAGQKQQLQELLQHRHGHHRIDN
jgi:Spy/CpxP family protein refolding chaperone